MASNSRTAEGFSILDRIAARPFASARASSTSAGRWTKDSASQSTPSSQTNSRSSRSFGESAATGSTTSGTFTPFRSEIAPPTTTSVSAKSAPQDVTLRRILPSFTRSDAPGSRASKISGWGSRTRRASPSASSRSSRNACPGFSSTGPAAKVPTRSLGPCRSARMAIGRPVSASIRRIAAWRSAMSACAPWDMFRRNTSAPASNRARMVASSLEAGPSVATILTFRWRRMTPLPGRAAHGRVGAAMPQRPATGNAPKRVSRYR